MKYLLMFLVLLSHYLYPGNKRFVFVVPSFNNVSCCIRNLESLLVQEYDNFYIRIIVDADTDGTYDVLRAYIQDHQISHVFITRNEQRQGSLANIFAMVQELHDDEIAITMDGDDYLIASDVLTTLNEIYQHDAVWMTYGSYIESTTGKPGVCRALPAWVLERNAFRDYPWVTSQLRTFYVWLFKKIDPADLQYRGRFFPTTGDLAFMFPMLEMARLGHIYYVERLWYVYNMDHENNDYKTKLSLLLQLDRYIRSKKRYESILI